MLPWHESGIAVKVELSTDGDTISAIRTDMPIVDTNADNLPDGWTAINTGPTVNAMGVADGVWSLKATWDSGAQPPQGSTITYATQSIPLVQGHKYTVFADLQYYDASTAPCTGKIGTVQYDATGARIWTDGGVGLTANADWQTISYGNTALQANAKTIAPYVYTTINGPSGTPNGIRWRSVYIVDSDPTVPDFKWRDITCDVRSITIRHGRERYTERYDLGSLAISVDNRDGEYSYAEHHDFNLRPGRLLRVTATYQGVTYPLAYSVLDSIADAYAIDGKQVTLLTAYDVTSLASNQTTPYIRGDQTGTNVGTFSKSGKRITALLDVFGYTLRTVDPGVFPQQWVSSSGRSLRDELGVTSDSEGSNIYAERDGRIVYRDRNWATTDQNVNNVTAEFISTTPDRYDPVSDGVPTLPTAPEICNNALVTEWNQSRIINSVSLANAGNVAREYDNVPSQRKYGVKTYQRFDFVNRNSSDLDTRANDYLSRYADSVLRLNALSYNLAVNMSAVVWTLSAFLNWLIRVYYFHPVNHWGWVIVTHVQSVQHTITPKDWHVDISVDDPIKYTDPTVTAGWDVSVWDTDIWDGLILNEPGMQVSIWNTDTWNNQYRVWANGSYWTGASASSQWSDPLAKWGP